MFYFPLIYQTTIRISLLYQGSEKRKCIASKDFVFGGFYGALLTAYPFQTHFSKPKAIKIGLPFK